MGVARAIPISESRISFDVSFVCFQFREKISHIFYRGVFAGNFFVFGFQKFLWECLRLLVFSFLIFKNFLVLVSVFSILVSKIF